MLPSGEVPATSDVVPADFVASVASGSLVEVELCGVMVLLVSRVCAPAGAVQVAPGPPLNSRLGNLDDVSRDWSLAACGAGESTGVRGEENALVAGVLASDAFRDLDE